MLVNRELANLQRLLDVAPTLLQPRGVIAVVSFHSGEDRLVKQSFREGRRAGVYSDIADDPIIATPEEAAKNPRSRSAKLRWAKR
jgi:16S rRNA (cytosine1402-N4)-methyltransferase